MLRDRMSRDRWYDRSEGIHTVEDAKECLSAVARYMEEMDESPMCAMDLRTIRDMFLVKEKDCEGERDG